ncbi:MAG: S26 family signal peptidase [Thermoplasmata archaeon]
MSRPRHDSDDDEEGLGDEEPVPRLPRAHSSKSGAHPVHRWRGGARTGESGAEVQDEDEEEENSDRDRPKRRPVFYRARDSLFFEPLVALSIVILLLVSLWAYTSNWPPVYVVESGSMQHGPTDRLGLINAGDLVLAQRIPFQEITTYYEGLRSGYSTYGEYGDVVLYYPNGISQGTPIIHRALLYVVFNSDSTYSLPDLVGLPCGSAPNADYAVQTPTGCLTSATEQVSGTLSLYRVGWLSANVTVSLGSLGTQSGLLTMGDNNVFHGMGSPDQPVLSSLVESGWIIGVARGMIPWFGGLKLLLYGNANYVPPQSWEYMGITIVALLLLAFGIHYALRSAGVEDERRRREEAAAREAASGQSPGPRRIRRWASSDDDEEEPETLSEGPRHWYSRKGGRSDEDQPRGRPRPRVHRPSKTHESNKRRAKRTDDE